MDWLIIIATLLFSFSISYIIIRVLYACDRIDEIHKMLKGGEY